MEHLLNLAGQGASGLPADLKQQADSLWKMLDDMAESDPEAYAKFIQSQAKEAAETAASEAASRPQFPTAVLSATTTTGQQLAVFLWPSPGQEVAMAATQLGLVTATTSDWTGLQIPIAVAQPPERWQAPEGTPGLQHLHCAVNIHCLQLLALPQPPAHYRALFQEAVCQWAEATQTVQLQRSSCVLKVAESWLRRHLQKAQTASGAGAKASVLTKPVDVSSTSAGELQAGQGIVLPSKAPPATKAKKGPLIEVLPDK